MNEVYAVLDIGSASIELLVGEIINSNLHVLFSKKVPSHGVKKGIIEDENLLVNRWRNQSSWSYNPYYSF